MTKIEKLEEFDKLKTKVLKYIMYKKRTEQEIRRKFLNIEDQDMLEKYVKNVVLKLYLKMLEEKEWATLNLLHLVLIFGI